MRAGMHACFCGHEAFFDGTVQCTGEVAKRGT
jgi:hypothetical protein